MKQFSNVHAQIIYTQLVNYYLNLLEQTKLHFFAKFFCSKCSTSDPKDWYWEISPNVLKVLLVSSKPRHPNFFSFLWRQLYLTWNKQWWLIVLKILSIRQKGNQNGTFYLNMMLIIILKLISTERNQYPDRIQT